MFGISLGEILVIFIISLLFFKPSDIFSFFSKIQDFLTKIKLEAETLKNEILLKEMKDVQEMKDEIYTDFIENEFLEFPLQKEDKINITLLFKNPIKDYMFTIMVKNKFLTDIRIYKVIIVFIGYFISNTKTN